MNINENASTQEVVNALLTKEEQDNQGAQDSLKVVCDLIRSRALTSSDAENFHGTEERILRMYNSVSLPPEVMGRELKKILSKVFPVDDTQECGMIVQGPISINSMCPHHFMPVRYHCHLGYIPVDGVVLGLSKPERVADTLSKQFVLQETLAKYIANALYDTDLLPESLLKYMGEGCFKSAGSIVTLIGTHTCMACRGIQSDSRTSIIERRGAFQSATLEARFNQQVGINMNSRPYGG